MSAPLTGAGSRRLEGHSKVAGAAGYTSDLILPGLAHARLVLSHHAAARIRSIDSRAARRAPGVLAVVTGADLPSLPLAGPEPPLAGERVYYAGQPVAAVVAESEAAAADAAALVEVDYEPLLPLLDPLAALRPDSPPVLAGRADGAAEAVAHGLCGSATPKCDLAPNVNDQARLQRGEVEREMRRSAVVIERRYRVPAVQHASLEAHEAIARPEASGDVTLWTATQGAFITRRLVAERLGRSAAGIRVVPMAVGGAFGGKVCLLEPLVTLLAEKVGRPVRLCLTRREEFLMGRSAPSCEIELRLGATRGGLLTALRARIVFDSGASANALGATAAFLLAGTYRTAAYDVEAFDVVTNRAPTTSYRAPGAAQTYFALESALDELAAKLDCDPIELRLRNASREGDPRPDGRPWPRIGLIECLEAARDQPAYGPRSPAPDEGIGVAAGGWLGSHEPAVAACRVEADGSLLVQSGSVDITGTDTTLAMIAAHAFGLAPSLVKVELGDSATAPYAGMAGGSKVTYTVGLAVAQAAAEARAQLLEIAAAELEARTEDLRLAEGRVFAPGDAGRRSLSIAELAQLATRFMGRHRPIHGLGRVAVGEQAPMFTVHVGRVRVDPETGAWRMLDYTAVQDVGRALNPPEIAAQVHGGALQGIGRALGEGMAWDEAGQPRTASLIDYPLPSVEQAPGFEVRLVEVPSPRGPFGARGVGEPPAIPGAAVAANAIFGATGWRITELPIRLETQVLLEREIETPALVTAGR